MNTPITYQTNAVDNEFYFKKLWDSLDWERRDNTPRREYYCNKIDVPYTYGIAEYARTYYPKVITPEIAYLWFSVEHLCKAKFEVCFINGYEDSKDQLGWHSDDSPEMDDDRPIAIVSLGAEREIYFREIGSKDSVEKLSLKPGSVCMMHAGMQDTHQHRIPKCHYECGPRISLTFRGYKL